MAAIKDVLRERRWFSREEMISRLRQQIAPEWCIRFNATHLAQAKKRSPSVSLESQREAGLSLLLAHHIRSLEACGHVERLWLGDARKSSGATSPGKQSWMCRATPKGIQFWDSKT